MSTASISPRSRTSATTLETRALIQPLEPRLLMARPDGDSSAYVAIELPLVGGGAGGTTWAYAINDAGLAVGESSNHGATAWRVDAGKATAAALPELYPGWSEANDVNELGQVVGTSATAEVFADDGARIHHAVLWQPDGAGNFAATDLQTPLGYAQSGAFDINDDGQVLGIAVNNHYFPDGTSGGTYFLWDSTGMHEINALPRNEIGWTLQTATDINNNGQIVGSGIWNGVSRGFRLDLNTSIIVALPGLESESSFPHALSDAGHVVGNAYVRTVIDDYWGPRDVYNAFLWTSGAAATDLGALGNRSSHARGINGAGTVVGWSNSTKKGNIIDLRGVNTATIWSDGTMTDINSLRPPKTLWQMTRAFDINDGGTIVTEAYGTSRTNNYTRGVLMQPKVQTTSTLSKASAPATWTSGSTSLFSNEPVSDSEELEGDRLMDLLTV